MSPYRGVRYYLKEQRQADLRPNTAKELFNLRYASFRNVVKRIFRVVKRKFKVLGSVAEYLINSQIHLVLSLIGLYNFIHIHKDVSNKFQEVDKDILKDVRNIEPLEQSITSEIDKRKDKIAQDMWKDYCNYIRRDI
jgi:hypothetical protein